MLYEMLVLAPCSICRVHVTLFYLVTVMWEPGNWEHPTVLRMTRSRLFLCTDVSIEFSETECCRGIVSVIIVAPFLSATMTNAS